jgi:phosphoglycerol transferase MdoB-like AlkP superfamily enzyme
MNLSFKHYYWRWVKNLCLLFLIMLVFMSLARLGFTLGFGDWTELKTLGSELRSAFWLGLRYDLMPLAYINAVPFLIINAAYFIPGKLTIKVTRLSVVTILTLGYFLLAWIYIFDYAFYSYFQDHLNILVFGFIEDDTIALLTSIWKNYNLPLWLSVILLGHWGGSKLIRVFFSPFDFSLKVKKFDLRMIPCFFIGLILIALFARGNFTRLPLSLEDAHMSSNEFINEISLNGVLTFNRALKIRKTFGTKDVNYLARYGFSSWQEAFQIAFPQKEIRETLTESLQDRIPRNPQVEAKPPHVVLLVMESFGSYWNDQHSEEFNILGSLKEHLEGGLHFPNFLSAENGTIGSMVSVATAQTIRPGARFLSESEFMRTPLKISGHLPYQAAGYDTHFIYGGKLGWRDLGKYLAVQKYDHLWGADEIKEAMPELNNIEAQDLGNEWGIFDEYLYAFIEEQLRTATTPQFFLVLTTSNHPPFEYPSSYNTLKLNLGQDQLQKITIGEELARKRFLGLQYANQKTAEFLTRIKTSALNDRTVVALTGDHSYWIAKGVGHDEEFKRFAVPFFISVPDRLRPKEVNLQNFGSHEDIFPTLYHLTLSDREYLKLGENLLSEPGIAINSSGLVAGSEGAYHHGKFWSWKDQALQILEETQDHEKLSILKRRADALIGLTDYYLKEEKQSKPTDAKNDPQ